MHRGHYSGIYNVKVKCVAEVELCVHCVFLLSEADWWLHASCFSGSVSVLFL